MSDNPAPMRAARAATFAAVCVALGAMGHSSMSGTDIPFAGLLGAFAVTGALAWLGAGRRRGPVGITVTLLGVQGALHLVFSGSRAAQSGHAPAAGHAPEPMHGHHHMPGTDMPGTDMPGTDMPGTDTGPTAAEAPGVPGPADMAGAADRVELADLTDLPDLPGMAELADLAGMAGHGGAGMIIAHVLAALFCAAWLAWGEASVFRLAGVLGSAALLAARPLSRALALVRARVAVAVPPAVSVKRPPRGRPRRLRGAVPAHAVVRRGPPAPRVLRATAPGRPAPA
ncbi:hypothetical protein ABZX75_00100 [Streptomyces sp. NPDC003038]|uniref:hypothetical protein n=1 Tax=unclassified Streptomyces TaxID=2593676 RepID=UPI0033B12921